MKISMSTMTCQQDYEVTADLEKCGCSYDDGVVAAKLKEVGNNFLGYARAIDGLCREETDLGRKKTLEALSHVCSLCYGRYEGFPPFVPFFIPTGQTPVLKIEDGDYKVLAAVVEGISNAKLRARVADVLWCCKQNGSAHNAFKFAKMALDAYNELEIDEKRWFADRQNEDWRRALKLAKSLGKTGEAVYLSLVAKLTKAYDDADDSGDTENALRWAIPRLLEEKDLNKVIPPGKIALGFKKLVAEVMSVKPDDYYSLQTYSEYAADWFGLANDQVSVCEAFRNLARFYVAEAEAEAASREPVWLRVADRYTRAISVYARMPKDYRESNGLDRLCDVTKVAYEAAVKNSMASMKCIASSSVDVTEVEQRARKCVSGLDKQEALRRFAVMVDVNKADVEQNAEKALSSSIVTKIFGAAVVSSDGRVVADAPADSCADDDAHRKRLWMETVRYAALEVQFQCGAVIKPAFETIVSEHRLPAEDFAGIVEDAELIPLLHKRIYAEGLYLGFLGHFTAATYVLAPEIENCIRTVLKTCGCVTTSYESATGLQMEIGLSKLIKNHGQVIDDAFSEDFVFLLKTIFSDHIGPNVRNEVAHGLKNDSDFDGLIDMFVWWFALRMAFMRLEKAPVDDDGHV